MPVGGSPDRVLDVAVSPVALRGQAGAVRARRTGVHRAAPERSVRTRLRIRDALMHRNDTCAMLWIPGPLPGLNELIAAAKGSGGRGMAYAKLKRQWTDTVWALARNAGIHKPGPFEQRVFIDWTWLERDKRRDPDNVAAGGRKLILDGLVKAGVLAGDGWKHVAGWTDRWIVADVESTKHAIGPWGAGVGVTIRTLSE